METPFEKFRTSLSLSQQELGDLIGVGQAAISQYESGSRMPKVNFALKFIEVAEVHGKVYRLEDVLKIKK